MTTTDHQRLMAEATQGAVRKLGALPSKNEVFLTAVVEQIIEASYQRMMLELTGSKRKNDCKQARETLRAVVASTIACGLLTTEDLSNVFHEAARNGEDAYQMFVVAPAKPGHAEHLEAARFRGWQKRIEELRPPLADEDAGDPNTPRGALVGEIHASVAERHPLGIACQLYEVISALAACEAEGDKSAIDWLDFLIIGEQRAGLSRSGVGPLLGEGGIIYDVSIDLAGMPEAPTGSSDAEAQIKALMQWVAGKPVDELRAIVGLPGAAPPWVQAAAERELEARGEVAIDDTAAATDNIETELSQ